MSLKFLRYVHDYNPDTNLFNANITLQSCTGVTIVKAFQAMLKCFGLTKKILTVNADNMTANDKWTTKHNTLDNSFEKANCVQCFNHATQLSMKTLLAPFNTAISGAVSEEDHYDELLPEVKQDNKGDNDSDDNSDSDMDDKEEEVNDDEDDGVDELRS